MPTNSSAACKSAPRRERPADRTYGGVGYGGPERPDLSNTAYLVEALVAGDAAPDDEPSSGPGVRVPLPESRQAHGNDTQVRRPGQRRRLLLRDPHRERRPVDDDERYTDNGGLRSYGSMSYSGFKSLVYAGLTKDDPRVKAVLDWVGKNYSVKENPGVGNAGLFYYYHAFAAACAASKLDEVVDAEGMAHDWRKDLAAELISRQNADGSWTNSNRQWFENDPNLATAFALLALDYCRQPAAIAMTDLPSAPATLEDAESAWLRTASRGDSGCVAGWAVNVLLLVGFFAWIVVDPARGLADGAPVDGSFGPHSHSGADRGSDDRQGQSPDSGSGGQLRRRRDRQRWRSSSVGLFLGPQATRHASWLALTALVAAWLARADGWHDSRAGPVSSWRCRAQIDAVRADRRRTARQLA